MGVSLLISPPLRAQVGNAIRITSFTGDALTLIDSILAAAEAIQAAVEDASARKVNLEVSPSSVGWEVFQANGADGGGAVCDSTDQQISATAALLGPLVIYNPNDEVSFIHFYNDTAANVTVGTTEPLLTIPFIGGTTATEGFLSDVIGTSFSTALTIACTEVIGDSTNVDTGLEISVKYKN